MSGEYALSSDLAIVTYAYLYSDVFHPFNPPRNLIASDNGGCGVSGFWLRYSLQTNMTYVLVVGYLKYNKALLFSIVSTGIAHVNFTKLGKFSCTGTAVQVKYPETGWTRLNRFSETIDNRTHEPFLRLA